MTTMHQMQTIKEGHAMTQLAMEQRAAMLAQGLQRMEAWDAQYQAFLADIKALAERNRQRAAEDADTWGSAYRSGVAAAYQHMFDELLAMYWDFLEIKKRVSAGVLGQPTTDKR